MTLRLARLTGILVVVLLLVKSPLAMGAAWRLETIAQIEGGESAFGNPAISGTDVAFIVQRGQAFHRNPNSGVLLGSGVYVDSNGRLRRIADFSTPVPGIGGSFDFSRSTGPSVSGGKVAFFASATRFGVPDSETVGTGIFLSAGGQLSAVATTLGNGSDGSSDFTELSTAPQLARRSSGSLVFGGARADGSSGVYRYTPGQPAIGVVADTTTRVPPTSTGLDFGRTFTAFVGAIPVVNEREDVAFYAATQFTNAVLYGVYLGAQGRQPITIADVLSPVPGGAPSERFQNFMSPAIRGDQVLFKAESNLGREGLCLWNQGTLTTVVDTTTPIPGGIGTFEFDGCFYPTPTYAALESYVVFSACNGNGQPLLFSTYGGALQPIVSASNIGSILPADADVLGYGLYQQGVSGDRVAFVLSALGFPDRIVVARRVPEPSVISLVALALGMALLKLKIKPPIRIERWRVFL